MHTLKNHISAAVSPSMHARTRPTASLVPAMLLMVGGCLLPIGPAAAQTIEYTVTDLPMVPDASTVPLAMNDEGVVVGWAQYTRGDFYLRGWRWSADEGLTLLPPPPGQMSDRYRATFVNNLGVIGGDGGGDSGRAWRFESGAYTIVDLLPGLDASAGPAINSAGLLVATAFDSQHFTTPTRALRFTDEGGTVELFPQYARSGVADINDAGQITAATPAGPVRVEADGSLTFLPTPPGFTGFSPGPINAAGDIAGIASCAHECDQAALWTEATGYQVIPAVGTRHAVGGLNDSREVVGWVEEGVSYAWSWSPQLGLRYLASLIDPDLTRNVVYAMDINNQGQIITIAYDYSDAFDPWRVMLMTPIGRSCPADFNADGQVNTQDVLAFLNAWAARDPRADFNGDGSINTQDVLAFLNAWAAGCG